MFPSRSRTRALRQSIGTTSTALVFCSMLVLPLSLPSRNSASASFSPGRLLAATIAIVWNSWGAPELLV